MLNTKPSSIAEAVDLAEDLQGAPGLDILVHGLGNGELRGPLLVVTLVVGQNAGRGTQAAGIRTVHLSWTVFTSKNRAPAT